MVSQRWQPLLKAGNSVAHFGRNVPLSGEFFPARNENSLSLTTNLRGFLRDFIQRLRSSPLRHKWTDAALLSVSKVLKS